MQRNTKFANTVAAIFWFIITAIRIADLSPIGLFAAVQSGALIALLIIRATPTREFPAHVKGLAWMGTLAPFAMTPTGGGQIWIGMPMQLLGLVVAGWSMLALGRTFGVAPADQGLVVDRGPYRWVRHPMYTGEITAIAGLSAPVKTPVLQRFPGYLKAPQLPATMPRACTSAMTRIAQN